MHRQMLLPVFIREVTFVVVNTESWVEDKGDKLMVLRITES